MESLDYKHIFEAIKNDDLKLFSSLLPSEKLNIRFGRFPLLSVLYLFESYKILNAVEKKIIRVSKFEEVPEYFDIYLKFKKRAKKCLRLYTVYDKIIYPIEMLAILDERHHLNKFYKVLFKNEEIVKRIIKIYKINHKTEGEISQESIKLPKKKLGFKQKLSAVLISAIMIFVCAFSGIVLGIVSNKTGLGTAGSPILIRTEQEFLTALENGNKHYKIENDLVLSAPVEPSTFSGVLDGNNHTIYAEENIQSAIISKLTGTIKNLNIEASVSENTITDDFAFFAIESTGLIENSSLEANVVATANADVDIWIAGFVVNNSGTISNCVSLLSAEIVNLKDRNCFLSAFAGVNTGTIKNSKTLEATFEADTVDLAGFANENTGTILNCENKISMKQTSEKEWHPNTSGFVNTNYGTIDACKNYGDIHSESTLSVGTTGNVYYVFASGVVCDNFGLVSNSRNFANIKGVSKISNVYSGGIVSMNETADGISAVVRYSKSKGEISAKSNSSGAYAGGIAAWNTASVENSGFEGTMWADSSSDAVCGGIVAYNYASRVSDCYSVVKILTSNVTNSTGNFFASIVGINVNSVTYVYSNHYVLDSSFTAPAYFYNSYFGVWRELAGSEISTTAYNTAEELPSEVVLND